MPFAALQVPVLDDKNVRARFRAPNYQVRSPWLRLHPGCTSTWSSQLCVHTVSSVRPLAGSCSIMFAKLCAVQCSTKCKAGGEAFCSRHDCCPAAAIVSVAVVLVPACSCGVCFRWLIVSGCCRCSPPPVSSHSSALCRCAYTTTGSRCTITSRIAPKGRMVSSSSAGLCRLAV